MTNATTLALTDNAIARNCGYRHADIARDAILVAQRAVAARRDALVARQRRQHSAARAVLIEQLGEQYRALRAMVP